MVTVEATGPVICSRHIEEERNAGEPSTRRLTTTYEATETLVVSFPNGHPNIDAYAVGDGGLEVVEALDLLRPKNATPDGETWEPKPEGWEFQIYATTPGWITCAQRYADERPDMTILDALELFKSWDVTNGDAVTLETAIARTDPKRASR